MKKFLTLFVLVLVIAFGFVFFAVADETNPVTVTLNGTFVDCSSYGQEATIVEDRTLVPLRAIFEALGADIVWDEASRTVISVRGKDMVELTIGSNVLLKNIQPVEVDVPARIMNDRTMVPVRVIAESFGVAVDWDNSTRTVILECDESTFPKTLSVESERKGKHVFGEFYYGMTMQNAWDAIGADEGEKCVLAFPDGRAEIQISDEKGIYANEDARIMGPENCNLVRLLFADDYLYGVYVFSDYLEFDKAEAVRNFVVNCYGNDYEKEEITNDDKYGYDYVWTRGGEKIKCSISEIYGSNLDPSSKLGDVCGLYITDESVEKLLADKPEAVPLPDEPEQDKTQDDGFVNRDDNSVKEDEEFVGKNDKHEDVNDKEVDKEDEEDNLTSTEDANDLAVSALETYLEACTSFNFELLSDCCIDSFGMDKIGIENINDALDYAGVTKQKLSATMIEKTYNGNEAYKVLSDAVIDVVLDFVSDASNLLYYTVDGVKSETGEKVVFEVTHYAPDISLMGEVFAESFDMAVKKAFSDGSISFSMTQEEMMPVLSELAADELRAAFDEALDEDTFIPSKSENVTVVKHRSGEWLVELNQNESEFVKALKKGGNEILELFGFEVD